MVSTAVITVHRSVRRRARILLVTLLLTSLGVYPQAFGQHLNPTGEPIGGGPGYTAVLSYRDARFVVRTRKQLIRALERADSLDVIYIHDAAVLDLTGLELTIPAGVTLASGRGRTDTRNRTSNT